VTLNDLERRNWPPTRAISAEAELLVVVHTATVAAVLGKIKVCFQQPAELYAYGIAAILLTEFSMSMSSKTNVWNTERELRNTCSLLFIICWTFCDSNRSPNTARFMKHEMVKVYAYKNERESAKSGSFSGLDYRALSDPSDTWFSCALLKRQTRFVLWWHGKSYL